MPKMSLYQELDEALRGFPASETPPADPVPHKHPDPANPPDPIPPPLR